MSTRAKVDSSKMFLKQVESHEYSAINISELLIKNFADLTKAFYEMQTSFLTSIYKKYKDIETANIALCFVKSAHLEILRKRDTDLDHNISLENFLHNINNIQKPTAKIVSIVKATGIPKETVRRKIKKLEYLEYINCLKNKEYTLNYLPKHYEEFSNSVNKDILIVTKFILTVTKNLNLNFSIDSIEREIRTKFSFYWYHFLSCELQWMKMWQNSVKDIDLVFIAIQALIPTLNYTEPNSNIKKLNLSNINRIIGKTTSNYTSSDSAISATSISEISGIPRATCIRKLEKIVRLGFLIKDSRTKRYYVNQLTSKRIKNITVKENIYGTITTFSNLLEIIIRALLKNKKY